MWVNIRIALQIRWYGWNGGTLFELEMERISDWSDIRNPNEKNRIGSDVGFFKNLNFSDRIRFRISKVGKKIGSDRISDFLFYKKFGSDRISDLHFSTNFGLDRISDMHLFQTNYWPPPSPLSLNAIIVICREPPK